jgi:hypothetical protein
LRLKASPVLFHALSRKILISSLEPRSEDAKHHPASFQDAC